MVKTIRPPGTRATAVADFFDRLRPATRYALMAVLVAGAVALLVVGGLLLTSEASGPGQRILVRD